MRKSHVNLKRFIDVIFSLIAIGFLWPLWIIVGIIIKLDSHGPVFFRQLRLGKNGRPFRIFKLRTMYQNAPFVRNEDGSARVYENDPRVTKIGRFLRKYSVDETPQFINVFLGEMSLVGPRPDLFEQIQYYEESEMCKLKMKPGITGVGQVKGRNSIPWKIRKKLDCWYVKNFSLKLDIIIMCKTLSQIIRPRGVR